MNADGRNQRNLTEHPTWDTQPHWSPDGRFIAFTANRDDNDEIYVMDADGRNPRRLTNSPASDWDAVWVR
jgi:Tol biopolymer transport system component